MHSQALLPLIKESMSTNTPFTFKLKGTSMRPFLNDQTVVTLTPVDAYTPYDVYLFTHNGNVTLHRLIKIKNTTYYFLGDALKAYEHIPKENIIAKVTHVTKNGKPILIHKPWYKLKVRLWHHVRFMRRVLLKCLG